MQKNSKYSIEVRILPKLILLFALLATLMIFTDAMSISYDLLAQSSDKPQTETISGVYKGFNLAFKIPISKEVILFDEFNIFATISYLLPFVLGILVNIKVDFIEWKMKKYIYIFFAILFLIIPIVYLLNLYESIPILEYNLEVNLLGLPIAATNGDVAVEGGVIAHVFLSAIASVFTFIYVFLVSRRR